MTTMGLTGSLTGVLMIITDEIQVSKDFKRREVVLTVKVDEETGGTMPFRFEFIQDNVNLLKNFKEGDTVEIIFKMRGRQWEEKYFNTFRGVSISKLPPGSSKVERLNACLYGEIVKIFDETQVSKDFKRREAILTVKVDEETGSTMPFKFEFIQKNCETLEPYEEGDKVKISFKIKGRQWEEKNFITFRGISVTPE